MSDSHSTPAPEFQEHLLALMGEMARGLGRQASIDRLMSMGLDEDDADDQEASLRLQLQTIRTGLKSLARDLEQGLERGDAIARCRGLGFSEEAATETVDELRARQVALTSATRRLLEGLRNGSLNRTQAISGFRELGMSDTAAHHFVAWHGDILRHVARETLMLGIAGTLAGTLAMVEDLPLLLLASLALWLLLHGVCTVLGALRMARLRSSTLPTPRNKIYPSSGLFQIIWHGAGRQALIAEAVARGLAPDEATVLVTSGLNRLARRYQTFLGLGLAALLLGTLLTVVYGMGMIPLALHGIAILGRTGLCWHRFTSP